MNHAEECIICGKTELPYSHLRPKVHRVRVIPQFGNTSNAMVRSVPPERKITGMFGNLGQRPDHGPGYVLPVRIHDACLNRVTALPQGIKANELVVRETLRHMAHR